MINVYGYDCTCVEESLDSTVFGCTRGKCPDATNDDGFVSFICYRL